MRGREASGSPPGSGPAWTPLWPRWERTAGQVWAGGARASLPREEPCPHCGGPNTDPRPASVQPVSLLQTQQVAMVAGWGARTRPLARLLQGTTDRHTRDGRANYTFPPSFPQPPELWVSVFAPKPINFSPPLPNWLS